MCSHTTWIGQGKSRQGKARQGKARQGKARQGKARQGKARQGNTCTNGLLSRNDPAQFNVVSSSNDACTSSQVNKTKIDRTTQRLLPCSTRPVHTVPRPEIEKMSSTGIRNGLSVSRLGVGIFSSTC